MFELNMVSNFLDPNAIHYVYLIINMFFVKNHCVWKYNKLIILTDWQMIKIYFYFVDLIVDMTHH